MSTKKLLLLNQKQIQQKIDRISYQILEDNLGEKELIIAGIFDKGYALAKRLQKKLEIISSLRIMLMKVDIDKKSSHLKANTDIPLSEAINKVIILVDDVLNTGRTMAYGLGLFLNTPLKKLRTIVLVDRNHRIFPISPNFTGLELATVLQEHIEVILDEKDEEDAVYLS